MQSSIDIEALVEALPGAEYNPEIFSGLIYRQKKPNPTIIMFESGKISSHGAKTEEIAKQAIFDTIKKIDEIGSIISSKNVEWIRIENVVGVGTVCGGKKIDLERLYESLSSPSPIYEPEQFPGLIYKPLGTAVTCLVFSSGKVITVGGKSESQVLETFQAMKRLILNDFCEDQLDEIQSKKKMKKKT